MMDTQSGRLVSALRVLERDKHDYVDLKDGNRFYGDNALAEFAFPPAKSIDGIIDRINTVLVRAQDYLGDRYKFVCKTSHDFDRIELKDVVSPRMRKEDGTPVVMSHWETGCNPNFDAYAEAQNRGADFRDGTRTGSFHIHIGNANCDKEPEGFLMLTTDKLMAVRLLDIFLGCASVIFDKDSSSAARRRLYGKAGEFRPTSYGVEYRVLGNYALRSPALVRLVYELAEYTMRVMASKEGIDVMAAVDPTLVQRAINQNCPEMAKMVLSRGGIGWKMIRRIEEAQDCDFYTAWGI